MKRRIASPYSLKILFLAFLISSGCTSTQNNSTEKSSTNITNTEILSVGSGVAVAWLINPIAGVIVGAGSYYLLEEGE